MAHAKLSPSAAKIWMACPGMPQLLATMQVEYKVGIPAATGTLIHEMVETLLKGRLNNLTLEEYYLGTTHHVEDFDITVDQEMIDCANTYVDYIDQRMMDLDVARPLIEEKVNMVKDIKVFNQLCTIAKNSFRALGGKSLGRIDIKMNHLGEPHFIEANLMPGLRRGYFYRSCFLNLNMSYEEMILLIAKNGLSSKQVSYASKIKVMDIKIDPVFNNYLN